MNYHGTTFNWFDESGIQKIVEELPVAPLFLMAASSDKGPEDMRIIRGGDFYKLYGSNISFTKHGQPLLQAANIIDHGGKILFKRIVADDAVLANLIICAEISETEVQKVNNEGQPLYQDYITGAETTESTYTNGEETGNNEPIIVSSTSIKYTTSKVPGVKTFDEVVKQATNMLDEDAGIYPLFVAADCGRGKSVKRFNITPNYITSKNLGFQLYSFNVLPVEGVGMDDEYVYFTAPDDVIYLDESRSLTMSSKSLTQMQAATITESAEAYMTKLSEITGVDRDELITNDILFGCDKKGEPLSYISIDDTGVQLDSEYGLLLQNGTDNPEDADGAFSGTGSVMDKPEYSAELVKFFNGTSDDTIYDVDRYKIDAVIDANYPLEVKASIEALAEFRQDFFYFRDIGIGNDSMAAIALASEDIPDSKFVGAYCQTYDIKDPFSKKQITVTLLYDLAAMLISHYNNNRSNPVAGILHGFQFNNMIPNTLNFAPKVIPNGASNINQKAMLDDLQINYATFVNDTLVLETQYTSQTKSTQLSYINNILAIQEIIHVVRDKCPRYRYSFITSNDLDKYKKNVNDILLQYKSNFNTLEFVYTQDPVMVQNKVFNASIKFTFKDYVQAEIFNLYALANNN